MTSWKVEWEIEVDADTPREAVEIARRLQTASDTTATVYQARRRFKSGMYALSAATIDLADVPRGGSRADGPLLR